MRIKRAIERIPGGMMVIPLLCGATLNTFAPHAAPFFGSFTGALFTGSLPILAVFYVCMGARITLATLPQLLKKGGALMTTKVALGFIASFVLGRLIGIEPIPSGWFAGLSTLAVVAAINDTNGGLYMSLMEQYGKPSDAAAYAVMSIESGPFLTMVSLGVAGLAAFPWQALVGAILPLIVGMILGNLDDEMRVFLSQGVSVLIPFFAFALGCTLDLHRVASAGLFGLALGVILVLVSAACLSRRGPPHRRRRHRRNSCIKHGRKCSSRTDARCNRKPRILGRSCARYSARRLLRHRKQPAGSSAHRLVEGPHHPRSKDS